MADPGLTDSHPPQLDTLRLFFALWPDEATQSALYRTGKWLHKHWGGRLMQRDTLHITLAFLGSTPVGQLDAVLECAGSVQSNAFELVLDQAGYWRHNRIGWLGASETPPQHIELVDALNAALEAAGFSVDPRPHVPHVTLLRKSLGGEVPACEPLHWPVSEFVLVQSVTESEGAHYQVVRRWSLACR